MGKTDVKSLLFGGVNVCFHVDEPHVNLQYSLRHQLFQNSNPPEITISVKLGKKLDFKFDAPVFHTNFWEYYRTEDYSAIRIHTPGRIFHRKHYSFILNMDGTKGILNFEDILNQPRQSIRLDVPPPALDEILAVQLLAYRRGLMFHSCGLKTVRGYGLLFTGKSGAGKSSTARLWQDTGKAALLSEERVTVRRRGDVFWLLSTAWHGSGTSKLYSTTPLHHLFILNHAATNNAHKLKPSEAVSLLLAQTYLPFWDKNGMEFSLEFLEDLCSSVPCYQLGFTLDQRAVEYVECLISS